MTDAGPNLTPLIIVTLTLVSFIVAGLRARARSASDYGIGGRYIGRIGGGAAIASNWMSAASLLGMGGLLYLQGYYALAYVIGWTGGYVLLLVLMAGQIRRFGKYTAPDFMGDRYASPSAGLISAGISIIISIIYCTAQFKGIGMLFGWLFGTSYRNGVILGSVVVVGYVIISGVLGVARNQQLQYTVLIVSFILPLMALAYKLGYFWPLPQFGYGVAIQDLKQEFGINFTAPFASGSLFQWISLCFTLMVGTAGLPHVLSRFYVVPNIRDARWSLVWGLFFIALIYWSAPAYAVFARLLEARSGMPLPPAAAGKMADIIVIKTAVMGGLPPWMVGVLAAGAVSAAFFTVAGLLINGAASFSHDIYYRFINPRASESTKMALSKGAVVALAAIVMVIALDPPGLIAEITAVAFALAGNTIFPAFLLGIWWGRANRQGVISGMLAGVVITFSTPLFGHFLPFVAVIFPLTSSAFFGAPAVIAIMVVVSLLTPPPPEEMRRFLAERVHGHMD
ncbi:VC_2705 family sodium/solute symporter [Geobacter benzoatilyticus]|uniref:VC_2705 family sodium/solute symporter n=1 Tax=Geobacter benzoatilyticus TaxID=2815309 RepID=A0ABX7Q551_9BACT|nr:VC_2705 family sodium/solute symporter [Geobacter benzoatilyticus]QSV46307.1 VC_2705 family sodium/solute symporter [Geobacter benzoatilyticus]